jgi:G3E family GTPase
VKANICIIDALNFTKTAAYFRPAVSQLRWADCVVINKTDLVDKAEIERLKAIVQDYNGNAKIITAKYGSFQPDIIDDIVHIHRDGQALNAPPEPIFSVSISSEKTVDEAKFLAVIKELDQRLLRLKGNIDFGNGSEYFEVVAGRILRGKPCGKLGKTAFAAIAWQDDKDKLTAKFEQAFK